MTARLRERAHHAVLVFDQQLDTLRTAASDFTNAADAAQSDLNGFDDGVLDELLPRYWRGSARQNFRVNSSNSGQTPTSSTTHRAVSKPSASLLAELVGASFVNHEQYVGFCSVRLPHPLHSIRVCGVTPETARDCLPAEFCYERVSNRETLPECRIDTQYAGQRTSCSEIVSTVPAS